MMSSLRPLTTRLSRQSTGLCLLAHPARFQIANGTHVGPSASPSTWSAVTVSCHHRRHRSSTTVARHQVRVVNKRKDTFSKARFSRADVPPSAFWETHIKSGLLQGLTDEQWNVAALRYADLALRDAPRWRQNMSSTQDSDLSPRVLHYIATALILSPPSPAWALAMHIFYTLTELSYTPSILTMVRFAQRTGKLGEVNFQTAQDAYERILRRGDDPNACTLAGIIAQAEGTPAGDDRALEWFRKAARLGGEEPGAWDWQTSCAVGMARIYQSRGQTDKARQIWEYAAVTLDHPDACYEFAAALEGVGAADDPKCEELLVKAAVSGVEKAARALSTLYARRAATACTNSAEAKEYHDLTDEWAAVAGDKTLI